MADRIDPDRHPITWLATGAAFADVGHDHGLAPALVAAVVAWAIASTLVAAYQARRPTDPWAELARRHPSAYRPAPKENPHG